MALYPQKDRPLLQSSGTIPEQETQFQDGMVVFGMLFSRFMDSNKWSHPITTNLAKACLGGLSWLHSSQISGIRQAKLVSPGPRVFIAIERLNYYVYRYQTEKKLIPGTSSSNYYSEATAVTEDGAPPSVGWWVEVFCGYRTPKDIDLKATFFTPGDALRISKAWGKFVRRLLVNADYDLITDLEVALSRLYPARDDDRVAKHLAVIRAVETWTPDELANELPALTGMSAALQGPSQEEELLAQLR